MLRHFNLGEKGGSFGVLIVEDALVVRLRRDSILLGVFLLRFLLVLRDGELALNYFAVYFVRCLLHDFLDDVYFLERHESKSTWLLVSADHDGALHDFAIVTEVTSQAFAGGVGC